MPQKKNKNQNTTTQAQANVDLISSALIIKQSVLTEDFRLMSDDINDYPGGIIIPINKPYRWTSADVIRKIKFAASRHFHKKNLKVGHAGTLDPLATGILLVCIGKATKLAETLQKSDKEYIAGITFGATTPSYDMEKEIDHLFSHDEVNQDSVKQALTTFVGTQEQIAPLFSAKNIDGVRAYELARKLYRQGKRSEDMEGILNTNTITIYDTELLDFSDVCSNAIGEEYVKKSGSDFEKRLGEGFENNQEKSPNNRINVASNNKAENLPLAKVRIACGKGTYIRSIARDLGEKLHTGAYLSSLLRSKNGGFSLEDAISIEEATSIFRIPRNFYRVGDLNFSVELHDAWKFMKLAPAVQERIEKNEASWEKNLQTPTRAGDKIPPRTFIKSKKELPENFDNKTLDFSQYEPFRISKSEIYKDSVNKKANILFTLEIKTKGPNELTIKKNNLLLPHTKKLNKLLDIDSIPPFYAIYQKSEKEFLIEYRDMENIPKSYLYIDIKSNKNIFFIAREIKNSYEVLLDINSALMLLYSLYSSNHGRLLLHASCIVDSKNNANIFLGTSGTGKSTHARLWVENIAKCRLLNDDNPVLRICSNDINLEENPKKTEVRIYGSPWSGKTPCYRNISAPLNAIIRLEQGQQNEIQKLQGLNAYAAILPAAANIRFDINFMDKLSKYIEQIVVNIPCYKLKCLPNKEAAEVCAEAVK